MLSLNPPSNSTYPVEETLKCLAYSSMNDPLSALYLWIESIKTLFSQSCALSDVYSSLFNRYVANRAFASIQQCSQGIIIEVLLSFASSQVIPPYIDYFIMGS